MKPKTKLQKRVVALSKSLSKITDKQKSWANDAVFHYCYVQVRNRNYCLECNEKWMPTKFAPKDKLISEQCPGCGKKVEPVHHWNSSLRVSSYWAIIDTCEEFQVVRMFFAEKILTRRHPAKHFHREVMQHWIFENGYHISMTALVQGLSYYRDNWTCSELEVRNKTESQRFLFGIEPFAICPGRKVLPIVKRNGYRGHFYGIAPQMFFKQILSCSDAETLLKSGQIALFKDSFDRKGNNQIQRYWRSICIAIRHGYKVENATTWLDYLDMLRRFRKDLHSPKYICPEDLDKEHNRYVRKIQEIDRKKLLEENKARIAQENPEYVKSKSKFFDIHIKVGDIDIVPLKHVSEFLDEGSYLNHCLFVNQYYKRPYSLVLSARKDGKPIQTVEVDIEQLQVRQCRGVRNMPTEHTKMIQKAVQKNMHLIAEKR